MVRPTFSHLDATWACRSCLGCTFLFLLVLILFYEMNVCTSFFNVFINLNCRFIWSSMVNYLTLVSVTGHRVWLWSSKWWEGIFRLYDGIAESEEGKGALHFTSVWTPQIWSVADLVHRFSMKSFKWDDVTDQPRCFLPCLAYSTDDTIWILDFLFIVFRIQMCPPWINLTSWSIPFGDLLPSVPSMSSASFIPRPVWTFITSIWAHQLHGSRSTNWTSSATHRFDPTTYLQTFSKHV